MSEGSAEDPLEDPEPHTTPIERKPVERIPEIVPADEEAKKRQEAESARAAAAEANQREIADLVKRNHAYIDHAVEMAKINAKKRENQERIDILVVPDGSKKRRDPLVLERKAAAKLTVGLVIAGILLVIGLIVGGIYFLVMQNNPLGSAPTERSPGEITSVAPPATGAIAGSSAADKTQAKPAVSAANPSGGALPGNAGKPAADSDTRIEGNIVSPENEMKTEDDPAATDKDAQKFDP